MTLELSSPNKWAVRAGDTGAEIAKYRLKGILYWDRQAVPVCRWVKIRDRLSRYMADYIEWSTPGHPVGWYRRLKKDVYRWERRK